MKDNKMSVLVFSVALNGYQWRYRALLRTHQSYAQKHGFDYQAVTKPGHSALGLEVAWLKVRLISAALKAGYQHIVFLDADTRVADHAPDITQQADSQAEIFAAKGFSGRFNSGVLVVKNSEKTQSFFERLLTIATSAIPEEDDVGWGENGHFIFLAKQSKLVAELDPRWNNNHNRDLDDFIRHFSRGPLYSLYRPTYLDHLSERVSHYALAICRRMHTLGERVRHSMQRTTRREQGDHHATFHQRLDRLANRVAEHYQCFHA